MSDRKVATPSGFERVFERIYRFVLRIPAGRVMTYGQISRLLGERFSPRLVGWAMHATPKDDRNIPWHRVINSKGSISTGRVILHQPDLQRLLLEAEGVVFNDRGHCDLSLYQWSPSRGRIGIKSNRKSQARKRTMTARTGESSRGRGKTGRTKTAGKKQGK